MFLNGVKVLRVVTVEAGARLVFLQFNLVKGVVIVVPGCQPHGSDAEIFQVRQTIDYALQITTVVIELVLAIINPA